RWRPPARAWPGDVEARAVDPREGPQVQHERGLPAAAALRARWRSRPAVAEVARSRVGVEGPRRDARVVVEAGAGLERGGVDGDAPQLAACLPDGDHLLEHARLRRSL